MRPVSCFYLEISQIRGSSDFENSFLLSSSEQVKRN